VDLLAEPLGDPRRLLRRRQGRARLALAVAAAATLGGCVPGILIPEDDILRDVWLRGSERRPTVALTFDDGPNGRCTEAVLDALAAVRAPAAFFVLGANVDDGANDALVARMVREGHTVGIHGYRHGVREFTEAYAAKDVDAARDAVVAALARAGVAAPPPALVRPPFGALTASFVRAVRARRMRIVLWTVSVGDWRRGVTADDVVARVLGEVRAGDVIVLHDGAATDQRSGARCVDRPNAAAAVTALVPALRARGLEPAPLADVLGVGAE
jgi:peptidoglycan/xylan/chitin deacetylase (PgdA/CDA1 family)